MKVISLLQPWASLVVIGAKKIVTRSWDTSYRGPLAIHANKKMTREQKELVHTQPFWDALKHLQELPLGAILGSVTLTNTFEAKDAATKISEAWIKFKGDDAPFGDIFPGLVARERRFGDYSLGRFGWMLEDAIAFDRPVPVNGSLGLWDYPICRSCGCTDADCRECIEKTGSPCQWVAEDLCSACV